MKIWPFEAPVGGGAIIGYMLNFKDGTFPHLPILYTKAGKLQFLAKIREKLKNLKYNSLELQKITMYINEQEHSLNIPIKSRTIKANFAKVQHTKCRNCAECLAANLEVRTSVKDPIEFLTSILPFIHAFKDPFFENKLSQYESIRCQKAKGIIAANILGCAISNLTNSPLEFDDAKTLIIQHYFQSQHIKLDVEGKYLVFKTADVITIPPVEILPVDIVLHTHLDMTATMTQNDDLSVFVAPDLY